MSLYSYKIFCEVSGSGSFVKTAEKMNLSPSAISHMIKGLEKEFGFSLFIRNRSGAVLTENGKRLLPYISSLVTAEENIRQEVNRINDRDSGTVRIGLFGSVASNWFVKILKSFSKKHPDVDVVIYQGSYKEVIKWLEQKTVDIAFTTDRLTENMNFMPLREDPLICIAPPDYVPKNRFIVTLDDLRNNDIIINRECHAYDAKGFLSGHGVQVSTFYDKIEHPTLFAMVKEGMGLCIVPELVGLSAPPSLKKYCIEGDPKRIIGLSFSDSKMISPLAQLLRDEIVAYLTSV